MSTFSFNLVKITAFNASQVGELWFADNHFEKYMMSDIALKTDILVAGFNNTIHTKLLIWNLSENSHHLVETDLPSLWSVDISTDGRLAAIGTSVGIVGIWDIKYMKKVAVLGEAAPKNSIHELFFNSDNTLLLSKERNGNIRQWDVENFKQICIIDELYMSPDLMVSLDESFFAVRAHFFDEEKNLYRDVIRIWDFRSRNMIKDFRLADSDGVHKVVIGPYNDCLTIVRKSQLDLRNGKTKKITIEIVNWYTGEQIALFEDEFEESSYLHDVLYNPDGTLLTYAATSGFTIWDVATCQKLKVVRDMDIYHFAFSLDGKFLVSGSLSGYIRVWGVCANKNTG